MKDNHINERKKFLSSEKPVNLTPSWEEQKLENEALNFKDYTMSKNPPPTDKYFLVKLVFILHGIGTLIAWNMIITAKAYFVDFKLASSDRGKGFLQNVGFASQIPNVLFNWLNVFVNVGGDLTKRIVYTILVEVCLFILTVILAMVDSEEWSEVFFWVTMISIVILNSANGVYQNTIYGIVAKLPGKYTGAVVLGSNISGLFATVVSMISGYIFDSKRTTAIYYFITAIIVLLICFDTYFALPLNRYFRYFQSKEIDSNVVQKEENTKEYIPLWAVFKAAFPQLFNVFFTFFVTLSVFPAVHSDIQRSSQNFFIQDENFVNITCFLTFNLFAMLGSLMTSWIQWPKPKYLVIPVVLRVAFLPLFLFCNYLPKGIDRNLPVYINNDWIYWIIGISMSLSSGYLSSLGMMYTPQIVNERYQLTAGKYAAAMLVTGIFAGVLFSYIFPVLV